MCHHRRRLQQRGLLQRRIVGQDMYLASWHGHIFGQSSWSRETNLIISRLAEISQAHAAILTEAARENPLDHDLLAGSQGTNRITNLDNFARPLMARDDRVAIEALRPGAPIELHIAATDTNRVRAYQHLLRTDGRQSEIHDAGLTGSRNTQCFH